MGKRDVRLPTGDVSADGASADSAAAPDFTGRTPTSSEARNQTHHETLGELEAELIQTRARLAAQLDILRYKVSLARLENQLTTQAQDALRRAQEVIVENVNDMAHEVAERTQAAGSSFADMVRRHPLPTTLIAAGIALLAAGGGVGVRQRHQDDDDGYSAYGGRYGYGEGGEGDYGGYVRPGFSSDASAATGYEPRPQADPQGYGQSYGQGYAQDYDQQDYNRRFRANYGGERGFESYGAYDSGYDTGYKPASYPSTSGSGEGYDASSSSGLGERASEMGSQASRQVKEAGRGVVGFIEDQPLIAGFVTAILGVLIGLAFPSSRRENDLMGGTRDHLAAQAREAAERARQVAQKTFEEVKETAKQEFSDLGAEAKEDGQDLADKGKAAAKRVADTAAETAKEGAKETAKETKDSATREGKPKPQSN